MPSPDYSRSVPAAERTLRLLELLGDNPDGLGPADMLADVGGSRSGLYALLNTLKNRRYVAVEDGKYRPGPALWDLMGDRPQMIDSLVGSFTVDTATENFDESVALVWPDPAGNRVVAVAHPDRPVRVAYRSGSTRPATAADGLVMTAGRAGDTDVVRGVRRTGCATTKDPEVVEVAVPVCADGVIPTAALVAGIPTHRAEPERVDKISTTLRQLAARLSYQLGAVVYQPYGWATADPIAPARELTASELDEFLQGLWGAQLACVRPDGTPHVVPLWYEWDGSAMWLAASPGASWNAYIVENPQVSITLDEPWPPLRRLFLAGTAARVDDNEVPGGLTGLRRRLAARYLGRGAESRPELSETSGWSAVRISPDRIHGRQGLGPGASGGQR